MTKIIDIMLKKRSCLINMTIPIQTIAFIKAAQSVTFDLLILKNNVFIFQEHSKNTQIQVNILPFS